MCEQNVRREGETSRCASTARWRVERARAVPEPWVSGAAQKLGVRRQQPSFGFLRLTPYASLLTLCALAFGASAQDGLRDPTQPTALNERARASTSSVVAGPRWRLQSTLIADDRRLAVINGKTLRVGDAVDRATLIEVRAEGVTLEYERVRMDILLLPASVRVKRAGGHQ